MICEETDGVNILNAKKHLLQISSRAFTAEIFTPLLFSIEIISIILNVPPQDVLIVLVVCYTSVSHSDYFL